MRVSLFSKEVANKYLWGGGGGADFFFISYKIKNNKNSLDDYMLSIGYAYILLYPYCES